MHHSIQYRPEIDGLRAIAVLAVLIFHAKLGFLPGGFVGVDIFFVISGYLITSIILHDEKRGNFSLLRFYERRTRRIFPALFVVILFCLIVGSFLFTPLDFTRLGWAAFASMAFFSNIHFAKLEGYFAPSSESQPLLHTWSLGVEEQFYLVAPLVILLVHRKFFNYRTLIFALLFLASLTASVYGVYSGSRRIFFMPHARACELLIGVAIAMDLIPRLNKTWLNEAIATLGLVMIVGSFFFITSISPFPGVLALFPTIGTGLLIYALAGSTGMIARLLSAKPMVGIGKISYSLYLWHWPLLALAEYEFGDVLTAYHRIGLLFLAVALSVLTYFYVEQPARNRTQWLTRNKVFAMGTAAIAVIASACFIIQRTDGVPQRLPKDVQIVAELARAHEATGDCSVGVRQRKKIQPEVCGLGDSPSKPPQFILWGDSHAQAMSPVLNQLVIAEGLQGLNLFNHGCPSVVGLKNYPEVFRPCLAFERVFEKYVQDPQITDVIMASYWVFYTEGSPLHTGRDRKTRRFVVGDVSANRAVFEKHFLETIDQLIAAGKRVTIIGPAPEMPINVSTFVIKSAMRGSFNDITLQRSVFEEREKDILRLLKSVEQRNGVHIIYPHLKLCDAALCYGAKDRVAYYADTNHLNDFGAKQFAPEMAEALKRMKKPN
jgi:peptidoglycan/LPS O-acetylase OafA/YrhL